MSSSDREDYDSYDDYQRMLNEERQRDEIDDELSKDYGDLSSEYSPSEDHRSLDSSDFENEEDRKGKVATAKSKRPKPSSSRQRLPLSKRKSNNQNLQHQSDSDSDQSSAESGSGQITASNNDESPDIEVGEHNLNRSEIGMRTILSSSRQRLPVSNRNSSNQNLQHHSDSDSGQSSADSVSGQITASNNEGNPVRNEIEENINKIKAKLNQGEMTHKKRETNVRSPVWNFFNEIFENENKIAQFVFCIKCKSVLFRPNNNTNIMLRHMQICSTDANNNNVLPKQPTTKSIVSQEDKERLKLAAAKFVIKDIRPYIAVQGNGLLDLCFACVEFGKKYRKATHEDLVTSMPSRNTVRNTVTEIAERSRKDISKLFKKAIATGGIGATTDTWSDDFMKRTYISVVAHVATYENEVLEYHRFVLCTSEVTEWIKTGQILIDHITKVFMEYDLTSAEVKKHVIFLSDRGSNIKWGLIRSGYRRLTCYAHIVHNLVSSMLNEQKVKQIIDQCAKLSSYVKNCGLNSKLKKSLKRHTTTRWNSVCIMLKCIIDSYQEVYRLLLAKQRLRNEQNMNMNKPIDHEISDLITVVNITELKEITTFLEPFKVISEELEGDKYLTLQMVWPAFIRLSALIVKSENEEMMELEGTYSIVGNMKKIGGVYMEKNKKDMTPEFEHKMMTLLTPSLKKLIFLDGMARYQFHQEVEDYLAIEYQGQTVNEPNISDESLQSVSNITITSEKSGFVSQYKCFDDANSMIEQNSELQRYLKHVIVRDIDPKIWWPENGKLYPSLFKIFLKLSPIPATSGSSERSFSHAGNIITDKRSVILPDNVNNLVVARNSL